ncbi:hypothetical protein A374_07734 [Fictibacillus macauensis ZFHKF-1]|uniref:Uncharacterized protein n=1 Tax=Fictibacillus macauensis ZFHKF-1 TaxID=1196324 RepID=I8UFV6_9BACL|nr:hypothetical protein [Fictibacillus macauensis]EIT85708.1 hypothetical protein A374_07734 [Fictibacillus macauensis ZFHKF-1]
MRDSVKKQTHVPFHYYKLCQYFKGQRVEIELQGGQIHQGMLREFDSETMYISPHVGYNHRSYAYPFCEVVRFRPLGG